MRDNREAPVKEALRCLGRARGMICQMKLIGMVATKQMRNRMTGTETPKGKAMDDMVRSMAEFSLVYGVMGVDDTLRGRTMLSNLEVDWDSSFSSMIFSLFLSSVSKIGNRRNCPRGKQITARLGEWIELLLESEFSGFSP
ncbi:hypothetical protein Ancab_009257 [Ancistrocladus abbreviatus]